MKTHNAASEFKVPPELLALDELREILYKTADLHDDEIIEAMFTATDSDHDGRISFNEFVHMMREE